MTRYIPILFICLLPIGYENISEYYFHWLITETIFLYITVWIQTILEWCRWIQVLIPRLKKNNLPIHLILLISNRLVTQCSTFTSIDNLIRATHVYCANIWKLSTYNNVGIQNHPSNVQHTITVTSVLPPQGISPRAQVPRGWEC